MNKAIQELKSILQAIGANPAPVSDTKIKINAPTVTGGNNEKTEN
jgi:hypothetical protein